MKLKSVKDIILNLGQVGRSQAIFGVNNTTYNEAGYTYNQVDNTYGGADTISDVAPKLQVVIDF